MFKYADLDLIVRCSGSLAILAAMRFG